MLPIYVINLDARPDRMKRIESRLNALGLKFTRVSAVDGRNISAERAADFFDFKRFYLENNRFPSPGEIGCAISHISIWEEIGKKRLRYAVVLEDDVDLSEKFKKFLKTEVWKNFDYLKIDTGDFYEVDCVRAKEQIRLGRSYLDQSFHSVECDPVPYSTAGYIISQRGAEDFLKRCKGMYFPIDLLPRYASFRSVQGFVSDSLVTHLDRNDSDITERQIIKAHQIPWSWARILHRIRNVRIARKLFLMSKYRSKWASNNKSMS